MNRKEHNPIVISGPSGSGKSVLVEYIEKKNPNFTEAIGSTTRERRKTESGKMNFISREDFELLIKQDALIEYCNYNGNYYGIPKKELEKLKEKELIFNVSYSSAEVIKRMYQKTPLIYLLPPTKEELLKRLGDRGIVRYNLGIEETVKNALKYEYLLLSQSDDFESTYNDFMDIVEEKAESYQKKLILAKNKDFVNNFYK